MVIVGGSWLIWDRVVQTGEEVHKTIVEAKISDSNLERMQQLETQLKKLKPSLGLVNKLAAPLDRFEYQDQAVAILNDFANRAGVEISQINFEASGKKSGSGPQKIDINVSLRNPLPYENFLRFIKITETELSPLQLASSSVSSSRREETKNQISVGGMVFYVYVK